MTDKLQELKRRIERADENLCNTVSEKYPHGLDLGPYKHDLAVLIEASRALCDLIDGLPSERGAAPHHDGIYLSDTDEGHNALRAEVIRLITEDLQ